MTDFKGLRLTEMGKEICDELLVEEWAKEHYYKIGLHKHPYNIQEDCFEYAQECEYEKYTLKKMKEVAFQRGLNLDNIYSIFGIVLRDEVLKHKYPLWNGKEAIFHSRVK